MSRVLLDTNVISELVRPRPEPRVAAFVRGHADAWISALTIHEIAYGAERARDVARRAKLVAWVAAMRSKFAGRIVPIDTLVANEAGRLRALAESQGLPADPIDALIAACAVASAAFVATRNVKDFAGFGVTIVDPWS